MINDYDDEMPCISKSFEAMGPDAAMIPSLKEPHVLSAFVGIPELELGLSLRSGMIPIPKIPMTVSLYYYLAGKGMKRL